MIPVREHVETELRNSFSISLFSDCRMIYDNVGGIKEPLKQDLVLEFCRSQKKDIFILSETHVNQDQNFSDKK